MEEVVDREKRTKDGKIVLSPQPEDTPNDPLNWTPSKRNIDLLSLGLFCMLGGGMTPILAAAFNDVAKRYADLRRVCYLIWLTLQTVSMLLCHRSLSLPVSL
jgi:hypothetical protein